MSWELGRGKRIGCSNFYFINPNISDSDDFFSDFFVSGNRKIKCLNDQLVTPAVCLVTRDQNFINFRRSVFGIVIHSEFDALFSIVD